MKVTRLLSFLALATPFAVTSCAISPDRLINVISVSQLLENRHELNTKEVKVVGFFDGHFEGSSLRESEDDDTLSVSLLFSQRAPVVQEGGMSVNYSKWIRWERRPVMIEGRFWIAPVTYRGIIVPDVTLIDTRRMVTVKASAVQ